MKTYKLYLLRHGLTEANLKGYYAGNRTDLPLCPEGKKMLSDIKNEGELPDIQKLYTSPLLRARQSAEILYPGFEAENIEELTEYDFGDFEGKTAEQLEKNPDYKDWTSGKNPATPGGEDYTDFVKRLALGLNHIVRDMMNEGITTGAVVMHGGAIMMLLSACAVPRKAPVEWTCDPGRGFAVRITPSLYHSSGVIEVFEAI